MASRYISADLIDNASKIGTTKIASKIRSAVNNLAIPYTTYILKEGERLDQIAGAIYGDASMWWAIAAASGIGWGLQVPPGTLLKIPEAGPVIALVFSS